MSSLVQAIRQLRCLTGSEADATARADALDAFRVALEQADTILDPELARETRLLAESRPERGVVLRFPGASRSRRQMAM